MLPVITELTQRSNEILYCKRFRFVNSCSSWARRFATNRYCLSEKNDLGSLEEENSLARVGNRMQQVGIGNAQVMFEKPTDLVYSENFCLY